MSIKNSLAQKKRWSKIPRKDRSKKMSVLVSRKHAKMTDEEKSIHAKKMVEARKNKSL